MTNRLTRGGAPNRAREAWQRPGTFKPQHRKMGGRALGTPNLVTRDLKQATLEAARRLGSDGKGKDGVPGYLTDLAENDPKIFVPLLRAVLPLQIKASVTAPMRFPTEEEIEEMREMLRRDPRYMFRRLEPVVEKMREHGMSAAKALQSAGLNRRLENLESIVEEESRVRPLRSDQICPPGFRRDALYHEP